MGMPGLGALGVTFGQVVAMDSPSARKPGDFNWGATLWHEMSHVFILTATNSACRAGSLRVSQSTKKASVLPSGRASRLRKYWPQSATRSFFP